jgi:hypothetical protein
MGLLCLHAQKGSPDVSWASRRPKASKAADFNLVTRAQGTDDTVKYDAGHGVGLHEWHPNGLVNLLGQIGPGHPGSPHAITKKSITTCDLARSLKGV